MKFKLDTFEKAVLANVVGGFVVLGIQWAWTRRKQS